MTSYLSESSKAVSIFDLFAPDAPSSAPSVAPNKTPKFEGFVIPPTDVKYTKGDSIRAFFSQIVGFKPADAISLLKIPASIRPKNMGKSPVVINHELNAFPTNPYDGLEWMNLFKLVTDDQENWLIEREKIAAYVQTQFCGKGSLQGLITRIKSQILPVNQQPGAVTAEEWNYVLSVLPKKGKAHLSDEETLLSLQPELNPLAQAGAPYFDPSIKVKDIAQPAVLMAQQMLTVIEEEGAPGLMAWMNPTHEHYPYMVMILSAKNDIYKRDAIFTKTRPFGYTSVPLRILFSVIINTSKQQMATFAENPLSINALGFSWANGGPSKLLEWLYKVRSPGVYCIAWGDDQLVIVTCKSGESFLLNPDVSGMDMKLNAATFDLCGAYLVSLYGDKPLTSPNVTNAVSLNSFIDEEGCTIGCKWLSVIQFYIEYCKNHPVLSCKQYMFRQTCGLLSGMTGTTILDEIASARLTYRFSKIEVPEECTPQTIRAFGQQMYLESVKAGFPIKKDGMCAQTLDENNEQFKLAVFDESDPISVPMDRPMDLTFLGMTIKQIQVSKEFVKDETPMFINVPCLETKDIVSHLVLKRPSGEDDDIVSAKKMQGALGIGFYSCGDIHAYELLVASYNLRIQMNRRPLVGVDVELPGIPSDAMRGLERCSKFPPMQWYLQFYATEEQKLNLHLVEVTTFDSVDTIVQVDVEPVSIPVIKKKSSKGGIAVTTAAKILPNLVPKMVKRTKVSKDVEILPTSSSIVAMVTPNIRQILSDSEGAVVSKIKTVKVKQTSAPKHPTTAPPVPSIRAANVARHEVKAFAKFSASQLKLQSATTASSKDFDKFVQPNKPEEDGEEIEDDETVIGGKSAREKAIEKQVEEDEEQLAAYKDEHLDEEDDSDCGIAPPLSDLDSETEAEKFRDFTQPESYDLLPKNSRMLN